MENFEFYNPVKVVFGEGAVDKVGEHAAQYGRTAMLVTYASPEPFRETIEKIHGQLKAVGVSCIDYPAITANPKLL